VGIGRLAARGLIGGLFIGHGSQKLFGSFGGPGIEGATPMMASLGLHPARQNAYAAGITEVVGGSLLALGAATPLAAAALTGTMVTAIRKVHLSNGPWAANGGWEYNAVLIAAVVALAEVGPGGFSVDSARGRERKGSGAALLALLLGVGASAAAIELGRRNTPAEVAAGGPAAPGTDSTAGDPVTADSTTAHATAGDPVTADSTTATGTTASATSATAGADADAGHRVGGNAGDPVTVQS